MATDFRNRRVLETDYYGMGSVDENYANQVAQGMDANDRAAINGGKRGGGKSRKGKGAEKGPGFSPVEHVQAIVDVDTDGGLSLVHQLTVEDRHGLLLAGVQSNHDPHRPDMH